MSKSCILFHFYIKPQRYRLYKGHPYVVSYSISTSNHNLSQFLRHVIVVVSYSISTSNHNTKRKVFASHKLYLIPFLHQTTTMHILMLKFKELYLIPFLHQTTTIEVREISTGSLYLIPFLHQTTTNHSRCFPGYRLYLIPFLHQTTTIGLLPSA